MNLVIDSSVLIAEALRPKGLELLTHAEITLFQPKYAAGETAHELQRRASILRQRRQSRLEEIELVLELAFSFISSQMHYVPEADYASFEEVARRRIPRDPKDWTFVAAALHLSRLENAAILTLDSDFLGCGLPTWTPETLRAELGL